MSAAVKAIAAKNFTAVKLSLRVFKRVTLMDNSVTAGGEPDAHLPGQSAARMGEQSVSKPKRVPLLAPRDKLAMLTVFVLAAAGVVALQLLRPGAGAATTTSSDAPLVAPPSDITQFRGICLQVQSADDKAPFGTFIKEIAATGANTICMSVAAFQQNCGSSSIFVDSRKVPSDKRLKELFALAHKQGLKVILMPIVLLENPRTDEWRGKIDPTKDKNTWDDWWQNYTNYILQYADLAQESKVDMFMVGSELVSVEPQTERWEKLIKQVRGRFKGMLSYSANWDHFMAKQGGPKFWDKLDIVGMTTYYDLCGSKKPTLDVLLDTWKDRKKEVLDWQATVNRPILFTEAGWPNQETAAQYPWDYYRAMDKKDPQLQKRCFEAFFKTWADEPAVGGYLVWEWQNYEGMDTSPEKDCGYCPKGKPAMEVITKYFRLPNGKAAPATAPAGRVTSSPEPIDEPDVAAGQDEK